MAETSYLWDNPGTGDSPALGYGNALLNQVIFRMITNGTGNQGVLAGWLNELEVTDGGGLNAAVDTGGAICYGVWFESDAATNVAIANNATEWVVVRASWAAQTARLAAIAPGAFTQNPGVTYDIPLAQVTTVAGAITLITDTRDFCEYSTVLWDSAVETDNLATDSCTIAKMIDQDRWLDLSAPGLEADITNPASWTNYTFGLPYRTAWSFVDGVQDGVWATFRVPEDITSANIDIHIRWSQRLGVAGDVQWCYSVWTAQPSAVLANAAACANYTSNLGATYYWNFNQDDTIASIAVTAGDIFHIHIYRNGAAGGDTLASDVMLWLARAEYTADA